MERRVVITGLGIISPVGNDVATFWDSLRNGVCGIESITDFPTDQLPVKIGGRIKGFDPDLYGIDKPFMRKQDWFTIYGVAAAFQAMKDSGLVSSGEGMNIDPFRLGVYVGSGIGGFNVQIREIGKFLEDPSGQWISPLFVPTMISNMAAGNIAIRHNATGPCIDVVTACASATNSIGEAFRAIRHGYADAIISGGTDQCTIPIGLAAFANAKALTRSEDPKYASLPFNADAKALTRSEDPSTHRSPSTPTGRDSSWRTAQACSSSRNTSTRRRAARRSTLRWWATAAPATRTT
jgi:3-oxoacyl-[acyl-carrier-protein] synthase II